MRAGLLRRRILIERPLEVRTALGEVQVPAWETFISCRAAVDPVNGRKFWAGQELQADVTTVIRIRHREGITSKMRVVHILHYGSPTETEVFEILAVVPIRYGRVETMLQCRRLENVGFRAMVNNV